MDGFEHKPGSLGAAYTAPSRTGVEEREAIERHPRENARGYWPGPAEVKAITITRMQERTAARLYWYRIELSSGPRHVVIKVPGNPADVMAHRAHGRPRLAPPPDLKTKYAREQQALELLDGHFTALADPRFKAIHILDAVADLRAIVMEEMAGIGMNRLFMQLARLHPRRRTALLRRAIENTGAWLSEYHQLDLPGATTRQSHRADVVDLLAQYCDHLATALGDTDLRSLFQLVRRAAERRLPADLPLALNHGDFAMRNVLVSPEGRVSVFDTLALWRAPLYEDVAKFLLAMRFVRPQVYSHGLAFSEIQLLDAEGWLLAGYFGDAPIPVTSIRIYRLMLLLDKWSFELALPSIEPRVFHAARQRLANSWFKAQARHFYAELR